MVELISDRWLEGMDVRDLEQYFRETQAEYLREWTDSELLDEAENLVDETELTDLLAE